MPLPPLWRVGTAAVNLSGALVLGVFAALVGDASAPWWLVALGFGFFGGYTTFSTWMVESLYIAREGRSGLRALALNVAGVLVAGRDTVIPMDFNVGFADLPGLADVAFRAVTGQELSYRLDGTVSVHAGVLGEPTFGPMTLLQGNVVVIR